MLSEDEQQRAFLNTPVGVPRSGYARYSAAMYFFQQGQMSAKMLEIYRICCKLDNEDPRKVAAHDGVRD